MADNSNIGLSYGIMSDKLSKQIKDQGFDFDKSKIEIFQKEVDAINCLRFGSNLLTDSMVDKIIPKLHKKIVSHIASKNKLKAL